MVSKTRERKQQTKILLVKFYCKEKWAAGFGAIFFTGTVYLIYKNYLNMLKAQLKTIKYNPKINN